MEDFIMKVRSSRQLRWLLVVIAVLALAALACGGTTVDPTPVPPTPVPPTDVPPAAPTKVPSETTAGNVNLAVLNQTSTDICYLYVTKAESETWGPDQLGDTDTVAPGSSFTVTNIPAGSFDILSEDCNHNVISWNYGVVLDGRADFSLTVSGAPDILILENNSSKQFCALYISLPSADSWGRSQLNSDHPVDSNTQRTFVIGTGTWDLRAETCDGQSVERTGQVIDKGETTWTLTD
jgi:hypothetical protein